MTVKIRLHGTEDECRRAAELLHTLFAHLTRAGLLQPADWGHGPFDRRDTFSVPLYRTGDLDALLADPAICWDQVRATPPRHRSPLAAIPAPDQPGTHPGGP